MCDWHYTVAVGDVKFGDNEPTNGLEATQCCHPFNFLLTKVADIPQIYNASGAIGIKGNYGLYCQQSVTIFALPQL